HDELDGPLRPGLRRSLRARWRRCRNKESQDSECERHATVEMVHEGLSKARTAPFGLSGPSLLSRILSTSTPETHRIDPTARHASGTMAASACAGLWRH